MFNVYLFVQAIFKNDKNILTPKIQPPVVYPEIKFGCCNDLSSYDFVQIGEKIKF